MPRLRTSRRCRHTRSRGRELVSNGVNFTATTGWTPGVGCALSVASSELILTIDALASFPQASTTVTITPSRTYRLTITGRRGTSPDPLGANLTSDGFSGGQIVNDNINTTQSNITVTYNLRASGATGSLIFFASSASTGAGTLILTEVSCRQVQTR